MEGSTTVYKNALECAKIDLAGAKEKEKQAEQQLKRLNREINLLNQLILLLELLVGER